MRLHPSERENKIRLHCSTLAKIVNAVKSVYAEAAIPQKALIETMIGAAIWYIPKPEGAWTGMISEAALKSFHPNSGVAKPKVSEEHAHPRKVAAKELLEGERMSSTSMLEAFEDRYSRVHYITPDENKAVTRFQRTTVFKSAEDAYARAGIHFVKITREELRKVKKRDPEVIERCLSALFKAR